jgi:hypothetical protein
MIEFSNSPPTYKFVSTTAATDASDIHGPCAHAQLHARLRECDARAREHTRSRMCGACARPCECVQFYAWGRMHPGECMCVCVCACVCMTLTDALNDFAQIASPSTLYLSGARGECPSQLA